MDLELDGALNKVDEDDDDGLGDDFVSSRRRDLSDKSSTTTAPQYRPVLDNSTEWA